MPNVWLRLECSLSTYKRHCKKLRNGTWNPEWCNLWINSLSIFHFSTALFFLIWWAKCILRSVLCQFVWRVKISILPVIIGDDEILKKISNQRFNKSNCKWLGSWLLRLNLGIYLKMNGLFVRDPFRQRLLRWKWLFGFYGGMVGGFVCIKPCFSHLQQKRELVMEREGERFNIMAFICDLFLRCC